MAENNYDLEYTGSMVDRILDTGYDLQNQGYIFRGLASHYTGTPTERTWLIAPTGSTGFGLSSPVPPGSIGICMYNGSSWYAEILNTLTLDSAPTTGSGNGITSGAVKTLAESITNSIGQLEQSVSDRFTSMELEDTTGSLQAEMLSITLKYVFEGETETLTSLSILAATAEKAGLMSAADKQKLDAFVTNIRSLRIQDTTAQTDQGTEITNTLKWTIGGVTEAITAFTLYAATTSKAGLMSAADKTSLDTLPSLINAGYLYAGIATPSTVPSSTSAKIYYIAIEGGTYTSFGNLNVTQGINILYKSDNVWSVAQAVGIDEVPTAGSDNLVKSGGVFDSMWPKIQASGYGFIKADTGIITPTNYWRYSDLYYAYEGLVIDVYSRIGNSNLIVAYYDAEGNFLKNISPKDAEAISTEYKLRSLVVPAGVSYVRYNSAYDANIDSYAILHTNSNVLMKSITDFANNQANGVVIKASLNGFVNANTGVIINNQYWKHTAKFPVSPGSVFTLYSRTSEGQLLIAFYDLYGKFLKNISPVTSSQGVEYETNDITVPNGAAYAIFHSGYNEGISAYCKLKSGSILENACQFKDTVYDYKNTLKSSINLAGKKIVFFGDSITYGIASCEPTQELPYGLYKCQNPYAKLLCENLGVDYSEQNNKAISGSRFAGTYNEIPSITSTLLAYTDDADVIYIAGGTNDYATISEIGSVSDNTQDTLYGALNLICAHLKANFSNATVFFALPINMSKAQSNTIPLDKYREVIYEVAVTNGYYVIDCSQIGFPQKITDNGTPDFKAKTIYDGIHPTELGHKIMADVISHIISTSAGNDDGNSVVGPVLDGSFNQNTNNTENIWVVKLPYLLGNAKKISFIAKTGTVNFYKVSAPNTSRGSKVASYTLVGSVVNTSSEDGTVKSVDINAEFVADEYIGINGAFAYKTSGITLDEYEIFSFTVSNDIIDVSSGRMAVGMNVTVEDEPNVVIVDSKGRGDYLNPFEAMVALKGRDTATNPITIKVMPGTYNMPTLPKDEFFSYCKNRYLSIVGTDKVNCILRNDNGYYNALNSDPDNLGDNAPLKISGNVYLANLTIISTDTDNTSETEAEYHQSYCIHIDADAAEGSIIEVHNCHLINNHAPCIGFGIPKNVTLKITDSELESDFYNPSYTYGGAIIYGHDRNGSTSSIEEHIFIKNCTFKSSNGHVFKTVNNNNALMDCVFVNNACAVPQGKGIVLGSTTSVDSLSWGNSILEMNRQ